MPTLRPHRASNFTALDPRGWAQPLSGAAREARLIEHRTSHTPTGDDEAADVALARDGDCQAFERLYRRHVGRILGLARRMTGPETAEDLTQDVFVRAWEKLHTFRGDSRFGTWLYRLAVNVIIESRRSAASRWKQVEGDAAIDAVPVAPADTPLVVDLAAAVDRLPDGARQIFVLHDVEGYKHREIGRLCNITTGTSKGQLHRARMMLRRYLGAKE